MAKIDIFAGMLGLVGFFVVYLLSVMYVGPFVGGMVGMIAGLIAFIGVSFFIMLMGRSVENRND